MRSPILRAPGPRWAFLAFAILGALLAPAAADDPLSDEDIVRGFVSGRSATELIALIEQSQVDFDVSTEMLGELRAAGLPGKVIEAMQRRQLEMDRAPRAAEPEDPADDPGSAGSAPPSLTVLLNPGDDPVAESDGESDGAATDAEDRRVLRFLDLIPQPLHATLGLDAEDRRYTDVAIFLGCTKTQHVPDHWRSKTPLGRDFVNTPRHRLLAWSSGARKVDAGKFSKLIGKLAGGPDPGEVAILELDVPQELDGQPEPEDTHDLILGIALQAGDRFFAIALDTWDGVTLGADGAPLTATIRSKGTLRSPTIEVRFKRDR